MEICARCRSGKRARRHLLTFMMQAVERQELPGALRSLIQTSTDNGVLMCVMLTHVVRAGSLNLRRTRNVYGWYNLLGN